MPLLIDDGKSVQVEKGDTLWDIAEEYLGSGLKYKVLATINKITNPDLIAVNQTVKLTSSSSSSSTTSTTSTSPSRATINQFGQLSTDEDTLFATWTWDQTNTESYKALWTYDTGDGVWFEGSNSTITVDEDAPELSKQSTFSIPANAKRIQFKVKPISKTYKKNNNDVNYWTAEWSETKTWTDSTPLTTPGEPSVDIEKLKLTAYLDNIDIVDATHIEFQVVKDNSATTFATQKAAIVTAHASYVFTLVAGGEYKVRCRAYNENAKTYSDWSAYTSNEGTMPGIVSGITSIKAASETSVYLEWATADGAETYDVEYATKKEYFDITDQTTTKTGIEFTSYEITGLETGCEYFFRVRATNTDGSSEWSEIKSVVIGVKPSAPTTWSSTTTAIVGGALNLYWIHNAEDGSSQTYADLEIYVNDVKETYTIQNSTDEDEKDKTSVYALDTSSMVNGSTVRWRVRTAGVTKEYGDWSIERVINVYSQPTMELTLRETNGDVVEQFPFYIYALPQAETNQAPIGYHLVVTSNSIYETTDNMGNPCSINVGTELYSKYFDTFQALLVEFTPSNINLENGMEYTATCVVSMNSGLTAEASVIFTVSWTDEVYQPNAEIGIDEDTMTASIRPYCESRSTVYYEVEDGECTDTVLDHLYGEATGEVTSEGDRIYSGMDADGTEHLFCIRQEVTPITDVWLAVYRREFDGTFTEIATELDGAKNTTVTDPHPALDFARYRIVATSKTTGAVNYYDPPGYPVGGIAVIIQWDEAWTSFETTEEAALEQPPWSGSLLKLPYNIDVSDSNKVDVSLIEYVGRSHPVSYYGTHIGQSATWNMVIERDDEETLYALRRLSRWMGDVYVREPSGSGYWAHVEVSFSQKHNDLTIPVTMNVTRVEGGA